jgi:hypothetical protein
MALDLSGPQVEVGLKRKFLVLYFRENFAKIYFRFLQKFPYENYESKKKFHKNFHKVFVKIRKDWIFFS